jgi:hypothetical protein
LLPCVRDCYRAPATLVPLDAVMQLAALHSSAVLRHFWTGSPALWLLLGRPGTSVCSRVDADPSKWCRRVSFCAANSHRSKACLLPNAQGRESDFDPYAPPRAPVWSIRNDSCWCGKQPPRRPLLCGLVVRHKRSVPSLRFCGADRVRPRLERSFTKPPASKQRPRCSSKEPVSEICTGR